MIKVKVPTRFMNLYVHNGHIKGDTNNSQDWELYSSKLPLGNWIIHSRKNDIVNLVG